MEEKPDKLPEKRPRPGRPQFEIDLNAVEKLAKIFCSYEEIAAFLGCSTKTLTRHPEFYEAYRRGRERGRRYLRHAQITKATAKGGDTGMLIWLGKCYLGQKETTTHEIVQAPQLRISQEQTALFDDERLALDSQIPGMLPSDNSLIDPAEKPDSDVSTD